MSYKCKVMNVQLLHNKTSKYIMKKVNNEKCLKMQENGQDHKYRVYLTFNYLFIMMIG